MFHDAQPEYGRQQHLSHLWRDSMKLKYKEFETVPRLAWCAQLESDHETLSVWHGPWVETRPDFFVEGAWDGPFEEAGFDASCFFVGTGAKSTADTIRFSTPYHPLEPLFLLRHGTQLLVANALAFLLERAGLELDPDYPDYRKQWTAVKKGFNTYNARLPTRAGPSIELLYCGNLEINRQRSVRFIARKDAQRFPDFSSYYRFLLEGLRRLADNARSPVRDRTYRLLASLSSGYDSTATAALVAQVGGQHAVTFRTGFGLSSLQRSVNDSGEAIAHCLGMEVKIFERDAYPGNADQTAIEFAACGDGFDRQLGVFEKEMEGSVFFTGMTGELFWKTGTKPNPFMIMPDSTTGGSLSAFRHRVGFLYVPFPCFGASGSPDLVAITHSEEMQPWRIGGTYDRPIPRRIAEDCGIPRGSFGIDKKGSSHFVEQTDSLKAYQHEHGSRAGILRVGLGWCALILCSGIMLLNESTFRFYRLRVCYSSMNYWMLCLFGHYRFLMQWGNHELQKQYRKAIGKRD